MSRNSPLVTANVGFWGTVSLNVSDFTRFARSQKDQVLGQALGLPLFMALFTFLGRRLINTSECEHDLLKDDSGRDVKFSFLISGDGPPSKRVTTYFVHFYQALLLQVLRSRSMARL